MWEQQMPLRIACIDISKAFDHLVRETALVLPNIDCPPKLQSKIVSFHTDTKATVQFNGSSSEPIEICSGVKQGCDLASTRFGIFFSTLLKHAFDTTTYTMTLHSCQIRWQARSSTSPDSEPRQNNATFSSGTCCLLITQQLRPTPGRNFVRWWTASLRPVNDFGLTISLKKTSVLGRTGHRSIAGQYHRRLRTWCCLLFHLHRLHHHWQPLLGRCLCRHIWRSTMTALPAHCCTYGSEKRITLCRTRERFNRFYMRSIRLVLDIWWQDKVYPMPVSCLVLVFPVYSA